MSLVNSNDHIRDPKSFLSCETQNYEILLLCQLKAMHKITGKYSIEHM